MRLYIYSFFYYLIRYMGVTPSIFTVVEEAYSIRDYRILDSVVSI